MELRCDWDETDQSGQAVSGSYSHVLTLVEEQIEQYFERFINRFHLAEGTFIIDRVLDFVPFVNLTDESRKCFITRFVL